MKTWPALAIGLALTLAVAADALSLSGARLEQQCGSPEASPQVLAQATDDRGPVEIAAVGDCGNGFQGPLSAFGKTPVTDPTVDVPTMGFLVDPATLRVAMSSNELDRLSARGFTQQTWALVGNPTTANVPFAGEPIPFAVQVHVSVELGIQELGGSAAVTTDFLGRVMSSELGVLERVQGFMDDSGATTITLNFTDPTTLDVSFDASSGTYTASFDSTWIHNAGTAPFGESFDVDAVFGGQLSLATTLDAISDLGLARVDGSHTFSYSLLSLDPRAMFVAVPEPSTGLLVAGGIAALMLGMRRRA